MQFVCSTEESHTTFDVEDQGKLNVCCNIFREGILQTEEGWELDNLPDALNTEQDDSNMLKMLASFCAEEFIKKNGWSDSRQNYLINEQNDSYGLKGIVFKAMIDHNRMLGFESLSEEGMHFHLQSTIIHCNSSQN